MINQSHGVITCRNGFISSWGYANKETCWFALELNQGIDPAIVERIKTIPGVQSVTQDFMFWAEYPARYYDSKFTQHINRFNIRLAYNVSRHLIRYSIARILDEG